MLSRLTEWEQIWSVNIYGFTLQRFPLSCLCPEQRKREKVNKAEGHVGRGSELCVFAY